MLKVILMKKSKIYCILDKHVVEKLKNSKFNGRLSVEWKDGIIRAFNLTSKIGFILEEDYEDEFEYYD